jgi:hypothetical protein
MGLGQAFLRAFQFSPVSNIPQMLHTNLHVVHYFAEKDKRSKPGKHSKSNAVSKIGGGGVTG